MNVREAPGSLARRSGFTLVEILIVAGVIGILAMLAVPTFVRSRRTAQDNRFLNDVRIAVAAFEQYHIEYGSFPPDGLPAVAVPAMKDHLARFNWTQPNSLGGQWDWDFGQFGVLAGVSVYRPAASPSRMARIDARLDDGNLKTGRFRQRTDGYMYIVQETAAAARPVIQALSSDQAELPLSSP